MAYRVEPNDEVSALVRSFSPPELYAWRRACSEIAANPFCRTGAIIERVTGIAPSPTRSHRFSIGCRDYVSGETVYFFSGRSLPGRVPVYVIHEDEGVVEIFYVRSY